MLFSAQLETTLDFMARFQSRHNEDLKEQIQNLAIHASRAANLSLPYLEAKNPSYYNVFKSSVDKADKVCHKEKFFWTTE